MLVRGFLSAVLVAATASGASAEDYPVARSFAENFRKICLESGPDDAAVAASAARIGMNVSVVGKAEGRTLPVASSGWPDDSTVMLNAWDGAWSCLMIRRDPNYAIPTFAVRDTLDSWPDGVQTSWAKQGGSSKPELWFAYRGSDGLDGYIRTNRLQGDAVLCVMMRTDDALSAK